MPTSAELLEAALKLPPDEREELAEQLLDSLEGDGDLEQMTEAEFEAELNRRREESLRDPSASVPWEQVRREMLEELD